jgi:hypothetical protein
MKIPPFSVNKWEKWKKYVFRIQKISLKFKLYSHLQLIFLYYNKGKKEKNQLEIH